MLEGAERGYHFPFGFVFDPNKTTYLWPDRDPCEPAFPKLYLTRVEAQLLEWILLIMVYIHGEMHALAGNTQHIRDWMGSLATFNGHKGDGAIEFARLWQWAGQRDTMADGWSNGDLRLALLGLFCHRDHRKHLDVQLESILPAVVIAMGRMLLEAQHLVKMHEDSEVEIDGWEEPEQVRLLTGCLNIFVLGCMVATLCADWADKLRMQMCDPCISIHVHACNNRFPCAVVPHTLAASQYVCI